MIVQPVVETMEHYTALFVGQKMVKRVQAAGSYIRGGQGRKRKAIAKFAKRLMGQDASPEIIGQNFKLDLPLEYLEEDTFDLGAGKMPQQLRCVIFLREIKNI